MRCHFQSYSCGSSREGKWTCKRACSCHPIRGWDKPTWVQFRNSSPCFTVCSVNLLMLSCPVWVVAGFRLGATCFLFVGSADSAVTQGVILEICFVVMGNGGAAAVCRHYSADLEQGGVGQLVAGAEASCPSLASHHCVSSASELSDHQWLF